MNQHTLIVIHGVGNSPPGYSLGEVTQGLEIHAERSDLVIENTPFARLLTDRGPFAEMIEVNWSDVARPEKSGFRVLLFFVKIVVALLQVVGNPPPEQAGLRLAKLYRFAFEGILVYCIYPPLVTLFWWAMQPASGFAQICFGIAATIIIACVTGYLSQFRGGFVLGWLWAVLIAAESWALATQAIPPEQVVLLATQIYIYSQMLTGSLLVLALVDQSLFVHLQVPFDRRVARLALLYFPFFILSAIGAIFWALSLAAVKVFKESGPPFQQWQMLYQQALDTLNYNLAWVEISFAGLVIAFALLAGWVGWRVWRRARHSPGSPVGEWARNWMQRLFALGALGTVALFASYVWTPKFAWLESWNASVLDIYSLSAADILPGTSQPEGPQRRSF